jgi:hypothetical protein
MPRRTRNHSPSRTCANPWHPYLEQLGERLAPGDTICGALLGIGLVPGSIATLLPEGAGDGASLGQVELSSLAFRSPREEAGPSAVLSSPDLSQGLLDRTPTDTLVTSAGVPSADAMPAVEQGGVDDPATWFADSRLTNSWLGYTSLSHPGEGKFTNQGATSARADQPLAAPFRSGGPVQQAAAPSSPYSWFFAFSSG